MKVFFLIKNEKKKIDFIFILLCSLIGLSPKWEKKRLENFKNLNYEWILLPWICDMNSEEFSHSILRWQKKNLDNMHF